jgi:capsular exopolysaccharide synthesis family protein
MDSANPQAPAMPLPGELGMKLYRYRNLVRNHWWILVITIGIGLAYEGYVIFSKPRVFESMSQMVVREELIKDNTGAFKDSTGNFFVTNLEHMKSSIVVGRAQARMALEHPELTGTIEISSVLTPRTNIFTVTGIGSSPIYTQKFLDVAVDEFLKWRFESRSSVGGKVTGSLEEQRDQLEKELKEAKVKLQAYEEENNMQFWKATQNKAVTALSDLKNKKAQLQDELRRLQNLTPDELLQAAAPKPPAENQQTGISAKQEANFNGALYSEYIQVSQKMYQRQADHAEWKQVWKPAHPKLKAIVADVEKLQRQINIIKEQNGNMVKGRVAAINAELKSLEVSIPEWEVKVREAGRKDAEHQTLDANVTRTNTALEKLAQELRDIGVGGKASLDPFQVIQKATVATPVPPGTVMHILIGLIGGLVVGSIILIVMDRADDRVASSTEMIEHFSESILGQIPNVIETRGASGLALLQEEDERYTYAESFRSLRSSLIFMPNQTEMKSILITSAIPNEGKSTIASNLAITMAAAGARVLLVDADLRRGDLAQLFDIDGKVGLSDVLRGDAPWKAAVLQTKYPTLSLIPRGPVTNQSGELLLRPTLVGLLDELKAAYDLVIFNTAPILAADDTPTLAPNFDGTLMVVRARFTSARLTKNALNALYQRQVNVLGLILNAVDVETPDYYYYRYNQYYAA